MLAGPGRVRLRVDVQTHAGARLAVGGAGLELATVGHHDGALVVVGMDVFLHGFDPFERRAVYPRRPAGPSLGKARRPPRPPPCPLPALLSPVIAGFLLVPGAAAPPPGP